MRSDSRFAYALILGLLCTGTVGQQIAPGSGQVDKFLGSWILNVEKSSPGPTGGTITIVPFEKKYKITLELSYSGGFGTTAWTVTDMKGRSSPVTRNFIEARAAEWCVKRGRGNSFTISSAFRVDHPEDRIEWRYKVSTDGTTLTRRVISGGLPSRRDQVLVFDKAP